MPVRFAFGSPLAEQLALDAYGAHLLAKYGHTLAFARDYPFTAEEEAELERLQRDLDRAHERAFRQYHQARVDGWRAAMRGM